MPFEFTPQSIPDVILVTPKAFGDERGFFMETYRRGEFEKGGIRGEFVQDNHARSGKKGVLRGLHFQREPKAQAKLVRCVRGAVWDVAADIRKGSATYGRWVAVELSEENKRMLYVPRGLAHGYVTLTETSEVLYKVDAEYAPELESGVMWNEPKLGIAWPVKEPVLSDRDAKWPPL